MAADVPKGDRLPPNWNYSVTRDGRVFFINEQMQTTTWLHPLTGSPVQTGNSPAQDLPVGWEQAVTLDGTIYFIDHNNQTTSFDHPLSGRPSLYSSSAGSPPNSPIAPQSPTLSPVDKGTKKTLSKQRNIKAPSAKRNPASKVMRRGWLYRWESGTLGKSWKKRWLVLTDFALFVYKDEDETNVVASVLLPSYRINLMTPADQVYRDFGFKLEHENTKTLYFASDNQGDLDRWMTLLTRAAMMKGQGFVRETNNNRVGPPRRRSASQEREDEVDGFGDPGLQQSWKDPGSYRRMQQEDELQPPDDPYIDGPYRDPQGDDPHEQERLRQYYGQNSDPRSPERESYSMSQDRNSYSRPHERNSYSRPQERDSFSRPQERDSFSRPQERDSFSRPQERDSFSRPQERDSYSRPQERDSFSRPQERDSYSRPHERDSYSRPQERDSFSRPMERDSYSRPQERDSYSRPHERDSFPSPQERDSYSRPQERDSYSRPHGRDSYSRPMERDSYSRPHERDSFSRPQERDSMSRSQERDSFSRSQERDSYSRPQERDSYSRPHERDSYSRPHEMDSFSRPQERDSMSRSQERDSFSRPQERDSYSRPQERDSYSRPQERDSFSRPYERDSMSRSQERDSFSRPQGRDSYSRPHERDSMSRSQERDSYSRPQDRDSLSRPQDRDSLSRPHERDSISRPQDRDSFARPQDRDSLSRPHERDSYSRPQVRDSYSRPQERDSFSRPQERDSYSGPHERDSYSRPQERNSYSRPQERDSYSRPQERDSSYNGVVHPPDGIKDNRSLPDRHLAPLRIEGADPYARIGDFSRSESTGFQLQDGRPVTRVDPYSAYEQPDNRDFRKPDFHSPSNQPGTSSDSPGRNPGLTVSIPPTYVNVSADESAHHFQNSDPSPERPPYPSELRQEIARDLAQSKTPRTSHDYLISAENEAKRMQQSPFFQYPSPRDGGRDLQHPPPGELVLEGRDHRHDDRSPGRPELPTGYGRVEPQPRHVEPDRTRGSSNDNGGPQELRSAYERVQHLRQSQRDNSVWKSKKLTSDLETGYPQSEVQNGVGNESNSPGSEGGIYSPVGSYIRNLDQPEDLYERGSAFRPPSSCTSSIKGDNSTLERKDYESYLSLSGRGSRSEMDEDKSENEVVNDAENFDGNYIQMTREYAREISKNYIQDKWAGSGDATYSRSQRKNKLPRAMSTVKEDPNMSDREVFTTREIKNLNKKYPLNGGRVRMSISAGDLIGKTHDELVLLLIQLRRNQSALEKAKEFYRQRLHERRPSEREYKKKLSDSQGHLAHELEQDHQVFQDYKTQLEDIENKLEVYKPLINLVDNMVTMGSLYGGDNYMLATQYRKHLLRPEQYTEPKDMLLFSRNHQEKKFVQEIEDEIKQLSAEEVDLEEKLERLYELDRNLQEQSFKVSSFREDKELLEKTLQGILRHQENFRDHPHEMSKLVHQQMSIEKELSLVMQQLAEASQQLEETTAENNKIEHEVALLRTKVNGELSRSRSAMSLGGDTEKTKQQMEKELAKVSNIMVGLSAERGRLSQAMNTLRRSSSGTQLAAALEKDSEPAKKKNSSYMITDIDTMESVNAASSRSPRSPNQPAARSKSLGDLRSSHLDSPTSPDRGRQLDSPDRPMIVRSYADGLNQPLTAYSDHLRYQAPPVISHQRQESSIATTTDAGDNTIDPDDPNSTWDISEADENTKRFFGIIPRERPKVLTVRDVKRQSEQRKEREKMKKGPDDEGSSGWYSVSASQQIPTDSESELSGHIRYPSDISSSYISDISSGRPANPDPLYENLPHADHLARTSSVPVLSNYNPNSRHSSIGLLAPKPFIPYTERTSSSIPSGIYTARPYFSEVNLSREQSSPAGSKEVTQTTNSAFSAPVSSLASSNSRGQFSHVSAPRPWGQEISNTDGVFNVKKSPKGRFMTISSSEPYARESSSLLSNTLHSAAGDLITNRSIDNVPDIVKSSTQKVDNEGYDEYTIEREILYRPDKVLIPERYIPDSDEEDITDAERIERIEKAEKIKRILANQSVHSLSQPDISRIGDNIHRKVAIEKQRRSQLLALSQDLAKQVTLKTKMDAAKRRKTWSGGQFAEIFPSGISNGIGSPKTSPYSTQSNIVA